MSDELKNHAPMAGDAIPHEAPADAPPPFNPGCRSSILEKTTPDLRRKLDRAILNYDPASYLAIFKKYQLAALGISYTAFYYYARKLRGQAALRQLVDHACPDEEALCKSLPHLLAQSLVEHLMADDKADPESIYRLTRAYAASANAITQRERTAAYRERTEVQRQHNERRDETARIHAEAAQTRAQAQRQRAVNHPQTSDDPDDPLAPWGRKDDGTPHTQEEFQSSLNQAIKEIWGLPPINPKSYLPHELVPGPDGKLVPFRELREHRIRSVGSPFAEIPADPNRPP